MYNIYYIGAQNSERIDFCQWPYMVTGGDLFDGEFDAIEDDGKVTFLHKVKEGPIDKSYGIHVARLAGLPEDLLDRADKILKTYESNEKNENHEVYVQQTLDFEEKHENSKIEEEIKNLDILKMTPMDAINYLYELKNKVK